MPLPGPGINSPYSNQHDFQTMEKSGKLCSSPNCSFYGYLENNGMCSHCMMKFADENPAIPHFLTQTAPLHIDTIPGNLNKHSRLKDHGSLKLSETYKSTSGSSSAPPSMIRDFSITLDKCLTPQCGYRASVRTAPYCHDCDLKLNMLKKGLARETLSVHDTSLRRDQPPPDYQSIKSSASNDMDLTSIQILEQAPKGPKKDHRLTEMFYRCKSDLCNQIGHPNLYGYCSTCYVRNYRLGKFTQKKQEDYQLTTPLMLSASANLHHGPQEPISDEIVKTICSIPGCLENRDSNPEGMCKECYAKNMKEAYNLKPSHSLEKLALNSGSWKMPTDPPPPFNPDFHTRENKQHSKMKKKVQIVEEHSAIQLPTESASYIAPFKKCMMQGCHNEGYEATNHLCQECFNVLCDHQAHKANPHVSKTIDQTGVPREMTRKCAMTGCDMYGSYETGGYCSKCLMQVLTKNDQQLPSNVEPLHPVEPLPHAQVLPHTQVYEQTPAHLTEMVGPRMQHERHLQSTGRPGIVMKETQTTAKHCLNPQCDRFGDPIFNGYCSQCSDKELNINIGTVMNIKGQSQPGLTFTNQTFTAPEVEQAGAQGGDNKYMEMNAAIEASSRRATGKCKAPNCPNFGNSRCKGYCNTCYPLHASDANGFINNTYTIGNTVFSFR